MRRQRLAAVAAGMALAVLVALPGCGVFDGGRYTTLGLTMLPVEDLVYPLVTHTDGSTGDQYAETPLVVGWGADGSASGSEAGSVQVLVNRAVLRLSFVAGTGWYFNATDLDFNATHYFVADSPEGIPWDPPPPQGWRSDLQEPSVPPGMTVLDVLRKEQVHAVGLPLPGLTPDADGDGLATICVAARAAMLGDVSTLPVIQYLLSDARATMVLSQPGDIEGAMGAHLFSYANAAVSANDGFTSRYGSSFRSWCVDPARSIPYGQPLSVRLVSSYDTAHATYLEQFVSRPNNLDLLNKLINTDVPTEILAGDPALEALRAVLTPLHVQVAIWRLIDPDRADLAPVDLGTDGEAIVKAILDYLSLPQFEGYRPCAGQRLAVIADPNDLDPRGTRQVTILELGIGPSQMTAATAWGYGLLVRDISAATDDWAMYFRFDYRE